MMPPYSGKFQRVGKLSGGERAESGEARLTQRDLSTDADEHGDRQEDRRQREAFGEIADPQSGQEEHDREAHHGHEHEEQDAVDLREPRIHVRDGERRRWRIDT